MKHPLKSAVLGITMAFGLAGVAYANQQPSQTSPTQTPQPSEGMDQSQMMGQPGQGSMPNNPEMRQRMTAMMERCQRMMSRMDAEQGAMPTMQDRR